MSRLSAAVAAAVTALGVAVAPAPAATAGAPCQAVDVSAARWFCAAFVEDFPGGPRTLVVSTSRDNGRTWRTVTAQGVPTAETLLTHASLPAAPATDPTLYLQTSNALFASTDDGVTFTLADYLAGAASGVPHLTRLVDSGIAAPDGLAARTRFAYADPETPAVVHAPFHLAVAGSPDSELTFLVPSAGTGPHRDVLLLAGQRDATSATPRGRVVVYRCDPQLTCAEALHAFPYQAAFASALLAPDFRTSGVAYVWTSEVATGDVAVWRSTDGARTFSAWREATPLTAPVNQAKTRGMRWTLSLAADPRRPSTLYARATYLQQGTKGPPREQLFRSTDAGRRWTRVAHSATLPWLGSGNVAHLDAVTVAPSGHVLVLAFADGYQGIFCSADGGRRWSRGCPR